MSALLSRRSALTALAGLCWACGGPRLSPAVRALISPVVLATIFERISAHLEVKRNHPLTTRRYYKRVAY